MKGNAKICKNVLSHPLGDLGIMHRVHLWLDGKLIVDFLSVIIEFFLLALAAEALLTEVCQSVFSEGVGRSLRARVQPTLDRSAETIQRSNALSQGEEGNW